MGEEDEGRASALPCLYAPCLQAGYHEQYTTDTVPVYVFLPTTAVHAGTQEQQQRQQQLERMLASAAKTLPAAQLGLATAPPDPPGPALTLEKASALGQVAVLSHMLDYNHVHRTLNLRHDVM